MYPEALTKAVTDAVDVAVGVAINKHVNGHIRDMNQKLDDHMKLACVHWKTSNAFMERMAPVDQGVTWLKTTNSFLKWLGLPALGAFLYYWFYK